MSMTKGEVKKLRSLDRRAKKLASDAGKLAKDTGKELVRQMKKS